jgi:hypothetical protein
MSSMPPQQPDGQPQPPPQQFPQHQYQPAPPAQGYGQQFLPGPGCPRCQCPYIKPVAYTWWGGILGPKLFSLVKCQQCKYQFNGKTGLPATKGIIIYFVVTTAIFLGIGLAIVFLKG